MKMRSRHKVLIVLISVLLVVGIAVCVVIKTDVVHLIIPRESVDLNDSYEVWQAIDKEVNKYYNSREYKNDPPEVRREKLIAILEELEAEGLIEEDSIGDCYPNSVEYITATGELFFMPSVTRTIIRLGISQLVVNCLFFFMMSVTRTITELKKVIFKLRRTK